MKKLITMLVALVAATFVGFAANGEEWYSYTDNRTYWIPAGSNDIWVYYGENQKIVDIKNSTIRGGMTTTTYNIVKIDDYAFNTYGIVEEVIIGSGIQTIGENAFCNCSKLSKITFKGACANIDANAFVGLNALTEIVSEATTPVALNGFSAYYSKVKVTVPKGTKATYKATAGWKEFTNLVEEGETPTPTPVTYINIQIQLPNEWNAPATYTWASGDEIKAMTKAFSIGTFTWWDGQVKANTKFLIKNGANTTDWKYATQDCKGQSADICMAIGDKMESGRYAATTTSCAEPPAKEPYIESFTVSPTSVQAGNAVTFTTVTKNFSGTPTLTYSVKFGTDEFKAATSPYTPTKAGLYTVNVVAKYNAEEASSTTTFTATAVPPAPVVKYYAKNNWNSTEWTWKEMTKDGSVYKLEKVIFGGTGFNFNSKTDDADAKWISADKFTGDAVQANDTVSFTYNPTGDVVTMTLIGRPKEADPIITAVNISGNKYVNTELTFTASTYGFKGTPTITYSVKKDGGEYKAAEGGKFKPTEAGEYIVKADAVYDKQEASKEQRFTVIAAPVVKSYVAGEFTDWATNKKELPAEIALEAKKYEFKQITGETWKGATDQGATMTRGNSAWKLDGEQNVTLDADVKGVYKFELVGDVFTVTYPKEECTWTMVGDNASLFGTAWTPTLTENDMEEVDGVFVKSYSNKTFKKNDKIEFKAAKNHAWATTIPSGDNASYTFTENGEFIITFSLDVAGDKVNISVKKFEPEEPTVTSINISGNKYVGEELTFNATVAGFSDEPMIIYEVKAEEGEYEQAQGGKFTPAVAGNYTVKATAFYQPEEGDAEEADLELPFVVTAAPESIVVKLLESSITWSEVAIYAWDKNGEITKEWPGDKIEANDGWFAYTFKGEYDGLNIIFNNNAKEGTLQTVDTPVTESACYELGAADESGKFALTARECTAPKTTWTMVGNSETLFGTKWDPALEANDMEEVEGVFTKSYTNVEFIKDEVIEFKAAKNHAWTTSIPSGDNAKYTFTESGAFDITFTLDIAGDKVNIDVKKFEPKEPMVTAINIAGSKVVGEELTFTASIAGFSADPIVKYEVKAEEGEYAEAEGGKFTPEAAGNYIVKATATNKPEEGEAEEAFKEVEFTVTEEPQPGEEITVKLLASSTTWSEVAIYAWDNVGPIAGKWPGTKVTAEDGWYSYTIEGEHEGLQIIFNNNVAEGTSQTVDTPVSESTCYELGAADESGKFALTVRECTVPQTGYGILINDKTVVAGVKNPTTPEGFNSEWMVLGVELEKDTKFQMYDLAEEVAWANENIEGETGITFKDNHYIVATTGKYDLYLKLGATDVLYAAMSQEPVEDTWVVAGEEALMGENWNPASEVNQMVKGEDGTYTLVKNDVALTEAKSYEYKFVANGSWEGKQVPSGGNLSIAIEEAGGIYTITFTLNAEKGEGSAKVEKKVIDTPTVTTIDIAGSKVAGEELTFTASVAGFSAEPDVVYYVKLKSAEEYTTPLEENKFTPVKPGEFMVKAVATYQPEEGDAEEAFKEVEFTVTEEPIPSEDIVVKLLASSTTWSEVAIYAWDNSGEITQKWPGDKVEAKDGWFAYTFKGEHDGLNIIFNDNKSEGTSQTVDTPVSESTCYELGAADESGKFALTARECTVPQTGYGIKIDDETVVMGEKNPAAENEWMILNQALAQGQTFALYDASTGATWAVDIDPASVSGIEKGESSYNVTSDGCYSFYLKLIYGGDQLYIGTGECPVPPAEPTVTAIDIAGSKVVGEELTFTATVAGFSGEPMIIYEVKAEGGEYEQAQGGKFTPEAAGDYTVKATAFYVPEEGDTEEAFKEVEFTVTDEPQPTTGITVNVAVPAGTPACYFYGAMSDNAWVAMTKVDDTNYTINFADAEEIGWGYQFSWGASFDSANADPEGDIKTEPDEKGIINVTVNSWKQDPTTKYNYTTYTEWQVKTDWNGGDWEFVEMTEESKGVFTYSGKWGKGTGVNIASGDNPIKQSWYPAGDANLTIDPTLNSGDDVVVTLTVIDDETVSIDAVKSFPTETPVNKAKATVLRYRNLIGIVVPANYKGVRIAEMSDGTTVKVQ